MFIHELGHFLVAKYFKVPVREFSIGMGPKIWSKVIGNTRYSLKVCPFGGSCAMIGEDAAGSGDFTESEEIKIDENGLLDFDGVKYRQDEIEKNNFGNISPIKKCLICLAGPLSNFILAFILAFILVGHIGYDIPVISSVAENSAAMNAKPFVVMEGDTVTELKIPGETMKISCYRELSLFMQLNNSDIIRYKYPLMLGLDRNGEEIKTMLYPKYDETTNRAIIGISFENIYKKPTSFIENVKMAIKEFMFYIDTTVMSLKMLIRGKLGAKDISGPVGTVAVMGDAISEAKAVNIEAMIFTLITLIILISANLGVMNLLPIPALDGGRIVFAAIEMIIGRPIDKNIEATANAIVMVLLLVFMIWVFGNDIYKIMAR